MTITIQIGNSDDKLTQVQWAAYVRAIALQVASHNCQTHFFACSSGSENWQNAAWIIVCDKKESELLKLCLVTVRELYQQDSVAWTEGETSFV